ncbi:MFS transporter [Amycolatopsis antarctica]|uniref:MFS transporter n=1 Tax=Amycolatopsis antarctica TaxID=1854586 RepID=A0A263D746_9PSEU|nr:MFS transporter [Amycolatopsis antarctica]OZM74290.1 MFS transporter [Amycolatopsis antarctica]
MTVRDPKALREPLRFRDFRFLLAGRTLAETGNAVAPAALAFAVLDLTGSLVDLGVVVGARSLASVLLVLFGGVIADRLPRSVITQGSELAAFVTQAAIAASVLCGFASIPLLIALSVVNGGVAAMSFPAASALTPQTVPAELLTSANAVLRMAINLGRIGGASAGGLLVAGLGSGTAIAVNAVVFLLGALAYRGLPSTGQRAPSGSRIIADLVHGWREFTGRTWIWVVVCQFMVVNALNSLGLVVLGPAIADDTIGRAGWGFVLALHTVGALAGGVIAIRWQPRRALLVGVAVVAVDAAPLVVLAEAPALVPLLAAAFLAGVAIEQFVVAWDVALQENVPERSLSRVYSYDLLGSLIAVPAGQVAAGPLAERFGRETTLLAAAAVLVGITLLALCSREVRTVRRREPAPATPPSA